MKRFLGLAIFAFIAASGVYGQAVDTKVCDVLKNPKAFDGKTVRIKGTVIAGFDEFVIFDGDCGQLVNSIWLSYPQGTKAKSGPLAMVTVQPAHNFTGTVPPVRPAVTLAKDKAFKQFDSALSQQYTKGGGVCMGCMRYTVQATLEGRLDAVSEALLERGGGKITGVGGFGNFNGYPVRLVLESVTDVVPAEVDYSKSDAITKKDTSSPPAEQAGYFDVLVVAQKLSKAMGDNPLGQQAQKDFAVFPKPKEQNGVVLGFGAMNEVGASDSAPAAMDSPDGVVYNCVINRDRLAQRLQPAAALHLAQHVMDLRSPPAGNENAPASILENNAWVVSTDASITAGAKYVTLPGAFVMWDPAWPESERIDNMSKAINDFLSNEAHLSR